MCQARDTAAPGGPLRSMRPFLVIHKDDCLCDTDWRDTTTHSTGKPKANMEAAFLLKERNTLQKFPWSVPHLPVSPLYIADITHSDTRHSALCIYTTILSMLVAIESDAESLKHVWVLCEGKQLSGQWWNTLNTVRPFNAYNYGVWF